MTTRTRSKGTWTGRSSRRSWRRWGFTSVPGWFNESWTYVLTPDGRIAHRFEGFTSLEELEAALADVL